MGILEILYVSVCHMDQKRFLDTSWETNGHFHHEHSMDMYQESHGVHFSWLPVEPHFGTRMVFSQWSGSYQVFHWFLCSRKEVITIPGNIQWWRGQLWSGNRCGVTCILLRKLKSIIILYQFRSRVKIAICQTEGTVSGRKGVPNASLYFDP